MLFRNTLSSQFNCLTYTKIMFRKSSEMNSDAKVEVDKTKPQTQAAVLDASSEIRMYGIADLFLKKQARNLTDSEIEINKFRIKVVIIKSF